MVIVAGWIDVAPEDRERFLEMRHDAVLHTRDEPGCIDYVFSADPIDSARVRLFERWEDRGALDAHLGLTRARPPSPGAVNVVAREVNVYEVGTAQPLG